MTAELQSVIDEAWERRESIGASDGAVRDAVEAAIRLLDSGEAREILRHYEDEPDFREQVNRYVHDFETMLKRVLADRDGETLSVTLLSSDMGKLYVALAQAIERFRR